MKFTQLYATPCKDSLGCPYFCISDMPKSNALSFELRGEDAECLKGVEKVYPGETMFERLRGLAPVPITKKPGLLDQVPGWLLIILYLAFFAIIVAILTNQ